MDDEMNNKENSGITACKFCQEELTFGHDKDDMIHCQHCHNIWDGFAQCQCNLYESESESESQNPK
jgi:hypothetical protein